MICIILHTRDMSRNLRSAFLSLEVLCLELLGLSLLDLMVVMPGEVWVMFHMTLDLVAVALSLTRGGTHAFTLMVFALPMWDVAYLCLLTLSWGKWLNTGTLDSLLTPVLQPLLTLCPAIDTGDKVGGHVAH